MTLPYRPPRLCFSSYPGDYVKIGYWSTIECHVGIICACLPAIRSLLRRVAPGAFGDTERGKTYGTYGSNSQAHNTGGFGVTTQVATLNRDHDFVPLDDMETSSRASLNRQAPWSGPVH